MLCPEGKQDKSVIMGIGHRVKSLDNPDARVVLIKEYVPCLRVLVTNLFDPGETMPHCAPIAASKRFARHQAKAHFPATPLLDFALAVEQITTRKKATFEGLKHQLSSAVSVMHVSASRVPSSDYKSCYMLHRESPSLSRRT